MAQSPYLQNLTTLDVRDNEIGEAGREALRNSPYLRRCEIRL
ncbi:leucine-rich repeat domain-containing protein [Thermogemmata fonticola]